VGKFIHEETITRDGFGEEDGYDIIETNDGFNVYQRSMHLGCFDTLQEATDYANEEADMDVRRAEDIRKTREGAEINKARADRARKALTDGGYKLVEDLLADLMHLCDEDREEYFPQAVQNAQLQFRNEKGPGDDIEQDARRIFAEEGTLA
jgi:hypothetical protein